MDIDNPGGSSGFWTLARAIERRASKWEEKQKVNEREYPVKLESRHFNEKRGARLSSKIQWLSGACMYRSVVVKWSLWKPGWWKIVTNGTDCGSNVPSSSLSGFTGAMTGEQDRY